MQGNPYVKRALPHAAEYARRFDTRIRDLFTVVLRKPPGAGGTITGPPDSR